MSAYVPTLAAWMIATVAVMLGAGILISVFRCRKAKRTFNAGAVTALLVVFLTTVLISCESSSSSSAVTPANTTGTSQATATSQPSVDFQATTTAQANAQATTTAQANAQATAAAQANAQATATAQANAQATAAAQANAQATATAQAAIPCLTVSPSRIDLHTNNRVGTLTITNCGSMTGHWMSMMNNTGERFVEIGWEQPVGNNNNLASGASQTINFTGLVGLARGTYTGSFVIRFTTSANPDPKVVVVHVSYTVF